VALKLRVRADVGPAEGVLASSRLKFVNTGKDGIANGCSHGADARRSRDCSEHVVHGSLVCCELRDNNAA
jgi:hypothetical protein